MYSCHALRIVLSAAALIVIGGEARAGGSDRRLGWPAALVAPGSAVAWSHGGLRPRQKGQKAHGHERVRRAPPWRVIHVPATRRAQTARNLEFVLREEGSAAAYLLDPTLRRGDIVVLDTGLHVFAGRASPEHLPEDFQTLAQSPLGRRPDLVALQSAGHFAPAAVTTLARSRTPTLTISRTSRVPARLGPWS